jgi:hypothetical protein
MKYMYYWKNKHLYRVVTPICTWYPTRYKCEYFYLYQGVLHPDAIVIFSSTPSAVVPFLLFIFFVLSFSFLFFFSFLFHLSSHLKQQTQDSSSHITTQRFISSHSNHKIHGPRFTCAKFTRFTTQNFTINSFKSRFSSLSQEQHHKTCTT